ncbi:unnamed protein product [Aureobasidium pullulans]|nr:unnamed protein product [Aureobasidium pullulans]
MEEMRSEPRTDKIDTHHHFVPDFYAQAVESAGERFPYAPPPSIKTFAEKLENFEMDSKLRSKINYGNALALLPRLAEKANF